MRTRFLRGDGTWSTPNNTTYSAYKGATTASAGISGLVPAATTAMRTRYLRGDGTWSTPTNTTYGTASLQAQGLMSTYMYAVLANGAIMALNGTTLTMTTPQL